MGTPQSQSNTRTIALIGIVLLTIVSMFLLIDNRPNERTVDIQSFEDCAAAGYPVMESYPPQCRTPEGTLYVQDVGMVQQYADEIIVDNPRPHQTVASPLTISGQARGLWFFEANFSAELVDADGEQLGMTHVTAQGDWMSDDFVLFAGTMEFAPPGSDRGELILKNANPSGLPEHDKSITIPVTFSQ